MNARLIRTVFAPAVAVLLVSRGTSTSFAAEEPPREWIEPETGHRVIRLSDEPGSQSLYFHQHPFTADGKKLLFTTPHGISAVDLQTRKIEEVVAGPVNLIVTGRKSGDAYYMQDGAIHAANISTGKTRLVAKLPEEYRWSINAGANFRPPGGAAGERRPDGDPAERRGRGDNRPGGPDFERFRRNFGWGNVAINADETMLVGIGRDPDGQAVPRTPPSGQELGGRLGPRWAAGLPLLMYTIDLATGDIKVIHRSNDWLNHLQCSPTDPGQILFCHEGPWHLVDRTWLIRTDGSGHKMIHPRTIDMEIEGHEFFSTDGTWVWYDLQTPRSMVFWLAGYEIASGRRTWYHVEREHWSVHYNISADGKLFCGDGGGPSSVANLSANFEILDPPQNGPWMYLFRPELVARTGMPEQAAHQVKACVLHAERLFDLSKHDYELEPNGIFTPDGKWIVFRSNLHGPTHVYAVEVARTENAQPTQPAAGAAAP